MVERRRAKKGETRVIRKADRGTGRAGGRRERWWGLRQGLEGHPLNVNHDVLRTMGILGIRQVYVGMSMLGRKAILPEAAGIRVGTPISRISLTDQTMTEHLGYRTECRRKVVLSLVSCSRGASLSTGIEDQSFNITIPTLGPSLLPNSECPRMFGPWESSRGSLTHGLSPPASVLSAWSVELLKACYSVDWHSWVLKYQIPNVSLVIYVIPQDVENVLHRSQHTEETAPREKVVSNLSYSPPASVLLETVFIQTGITAGWKGILKRLQTLLDRWRLLFQELVMMGPKMSTLGLLPSNVPIMLNTRCLSTPEELLGVGVYWSGHWPPPLDTTIGLRKRHLIAAGDPKTDNKTPSFWMLLEPVKEVPSVTKERVDGGGVGWVLRESGWLVSQSCLHQGWYRSAVVDGRAVTAITVVCVSTSARSWTGGEVLVLMGIGLRLRTGTGTGEIQGGWLHGVLFVGEGDGPSSASGVDSSGASKSKMELLDRQRTLVGDFDSNWRSRWKVGIDGDRDISVWKREWGVGISNSGIVTL
ncbi:hypothetical protein BDN72DRAFT_864906 [Pluteus cervinus]|uniref:Uncharacterized protein n=1 Tax=Pluteus cervinus TaxID=181527 RepID=A0ACD3A265_9AGAR|nr:hypothetical protein BDN72DRAFT_864906 [Pluteus cervinus]